jgi:ABC-type dipeptide/oligopeptide/nickel transport system permease subunit
MTQQATEFSPAITLGELKELQRESRLENLGRAWYKFSRNPLSIVGGTTVLIIVLLAIFAPYVTPYPEQAQKPFTDFANASLPPSWEHPFGTDEIGRDVFSRTIFGYRFSLTIGIVVLALVVPSGVLLGLVAGYYQGTWIDTVIMRITDIFLAVPPLILALAIASVLEPIRWWLSPLCGGRGTHVWSTACRVLYVTNFSSVQRSSPAPATPISSSARSCPTASRLFLPK